MVKKRQFNNVQTTCEHISEFDYKPGECRKPYRMIVLRKTTNEFKEERLLFNDIRYSTPGTVKHYKSPSRDGFYRGYELTFLIFFNNKVVSSSSDWWESIFLCDGNNTSRLFQDTDRLASPQKAGKPLPVRPIAKYKM